MKSLSICPLREGAEYDAIFCLKPCSEQSSKGSRIQQGTLLLSDKLESLDRVLHSLFLLLQLQKISLKSFFLYPELLDPHGINLLTCRTACKRTEEVTTGKGEHDHDGHQHYILPHNV
ncbi:MAG: DUF3890 domain-containing protein [Bacteroidales bacterium]|nr:DUF3890 domain-containing protein [Bacteroidales bacterium]